MGKFLGTPLAAVMVANDDKVIVKDFPLKRLPELPEENLVSVVDQSHGCGFPRETQRLYVINDDRNVKYFHLYLRGHQDLLHSPPRPQEIGDDEKFWGPLTSMVVGFLEVTVDDSGGRVYIKAMAVRPGWRRSSMLAKMLDWAQDKWPQYILFGQFTKSGAAAFSEWRKSRGLLPLIVVPNVMARIPELIDRQSFAWVLKEKPHLLTAAHREYFAEKGWL